MPEIEAGKILAVKTSARTIFKTVNQNVKEPQNIYHLQ